MHSERWKEILRLEPGADQVQRRAARAREAALRRLDELAPPRAPLRWAPMALAASLVAGAAGVWSTTRKPLPPQAAPAQQFLKQERLEMHWTLSDGTRVHWVFDDRFGL
jgi:hypothetical protein